MTQATCVDMADSASLSEFRKSKPQKRARPATGNPTSRHNYQRLSKSSRFEHENWQKNEVEIAIQKL